MARVIDFRTRQKDEADEAAAEARQRLAELGTQLDEARRQATTAASAAATLQAAHAALRRRLQAATMPGDASDLVEQIEDNLRLQREANHTLAARADEVARLEREQSAAAASVAATAAAVAAAAAGLAEATALDNRLNGWRAALNDPGLADAVADAGTATTVDPYTTAQTWLQALLTEDLLDMYRERARFARDQRAAEHARVRRAVTAAATARTTNEKLVAARMTAAADFADVTERVRHVVESTVGRYAAALAALARIAARGPDDAPPAAVLDRLTDRAAAAAAVAPDEKALHDAERALWAAQTTLDEEALKAIAADPEVVVDTAADLAGERAAVAAAETARDTKAETFAANKGPLDLWEVAVPPEVLADVLAFLDAEAVIDTAAAVTPGALETELDADESAYAAAADAEWNHRRSTDRLDAEVVARTQADVAAGVRAATALVAAVRGDR